MARPLRIEFAGAHYHVMSRGNDRKKIVRDDSDREKRLDWLRRTVETYGWRLHAFVLMNNHDHLFIETPEPNLSAGMQFLNGSYTSYFNRRYRRAGHLFQGRFKSQLIEEQGYYLEVSRYIHLNPVRAKCVERPERYRWGSYPGYHNGRRTLPWGTYDGVLGEFGSDARQSRAEYRRFVAGAVGTKVDSPFKEAYRGMLLGSPAFISRIGELLADRPSDRSMPDLAHLRARPSLARIRELVAEEFGADASAWVAGRRCDSIARAVAAHLSRRQFGYSGRDVADALGYASASSVSQAIRRVEAMNTQCRRSMKHLANLLTNDYSSSDPK